MIAHLSHDLRVLICEDEYLLAMDLAQQLESFGVQVAGIVGNLAELQHAVGAATSPAHIAFLDVQLVDGKVYDIVPALLDAGIAVIFCSGYPPSDRPASLTHLPWLAKPFRAEDVFKALQQALDARSDNQSV